MAAARIGRRLGPFDLAAVPIGAIQARGERNVLRVSMENLMRARHNPFFDYMAQRIRTAIATDAQ